MSIKSKITANIPFNKNGKFISHLKVPNSSNLSGWGSVLVPIVVVRNGDGPTVLLTGGSHGDEYEGPIALRNLSVNLSPDDLNGMVIIIPFLNYPAALAGTRLSPVDNKNMNRCFPGNPNGTITDIIAHYVFHELVSRSDAVLDMHSGGSSMIFTPCAVMHFLDDKQLMLRTATTLSSFGAPISLVLRELDSEGMLDSVVEETGKMFISTELAGGGSVTPEALSIADQGIRNLLRHLGVLQTGGYNDAETRFMQTPENGGYLMASTSGLYEALVNVGEPVSSGQLLGRIHNMERLWLDSVEVRSQIDGLLITRAGRGPVRHGDTIAVIATDYDITRMEG